MKDCTHCKHASWTRTKTGALHPSGDGRCTYQVKLPTLPASKYWYLNPSVAGGYINRREPLDKDCVYWEKK